MRLFLLTALVMVFFAANSILTRVALSGGLIGPADFAAVRLVSGAGLLAVLVAWRDARPWWLGETSAVSVGALALYVVGFSFAYLSLPAGLGALILFGGVQITMFAGATARGERPPPRRWAGMAVAFAGLVWLLSPAGVAPDSTGTVLMAAAALGWGVYSLIGKTVSDALPATAGNFLLAVPVGLLLLFVVPGGGAVRPAGLVYAVLSGAVTSGLGYALWYAVLPRLDASVASVVQLSVPVIALAAGALLLGEAVTPRLMLAAAAVLAGIALASARRPAPRAA